MRTAKLHSYIPEPQPVKSDYLIAAHYYPGWKKGGTNIHNGFADLADYPGRTPLLGYYKEEDPEVCDWEIKWAVEHGIGCFIYCWYRKRENVGHKITLEDLRLGHAIHEAYKHCRFKKYMKFAIMWECDWGLIQDFDDLTNNLIPFWVENYFSDPQYLTVDDKPVLYIYGMKNLVKLFGSEEKFGEMVQLIRKEMVKHGFPGIHISVTHCNKEIHSRKYGYTPIEVIRDEIGVDSIFQYCQQIPYDEMSEAQYATYLETMMLDSKLIADDQLKKIRDRIEFDPYFSMFTASAMRDSRPWFKVLNVNPRRIMQFHLSPTEYRDLLMQMKELLDGLPEGAIGRKIVIIDAWNEWSEGHYVAPCLENGFQYLQAIREVLTYRDNLPDYRVPEMLDLGPYEQE